MATKYAALWLCFLLQTAVGAMFQVVEHQLRSKTGACLDDCEDAWVVTPEYACVVDGATSPTSKRWTRFNLTGGQWASQILCRAIGELSSSKITAEDIVAELTGSLHQAYQEEDGALQVMTECPEERATASLVLYSNRLQQVILVGDCQVAFLNKAGEIVQHHQPTKYIDTVTSQARACFWQAEKLNHDFEEEDTDPGRDMIHPLLLRQRCFQNNPRAPLPYRYWTMDGFPIAKEGIQVITVPESVHEIILASDGYPMLYPTLDETEAYLHETITEDPMMISKYPTTKGVRKGAESFDDRTYLRIKLD